jgi:DHA3 family macrolide efflux protein-like MFS transporter
VFLNKLFINKNLGLLLCGQFISEIGDKFYALALSLWVLETTGSPSMMGLVLFSSMVPAIVLGFFIGVVIDRYDRKALLVAADLLRGLIVAVVVIVYYMDLLSLTVIITAQILLSICSAFFDPALQSLIPQVVERERLAKANSMSSLVGGIAMIIGPVLGGLSVAYIGYTFVFIFNSLSFIVSALFKALLRLPGITNKAVHEKSYKESILEGYKYILSRKRLVVIIAVVVLVHFFVGSVQVIIPVLATKLPGNGAKNLGYFQTFFGLGVVVTAFLLSIRKHKNREERSVFWSITGTGLIYVACGVTIRLGIGGIFPFLMIFMLLSSAIIVISTNYQTILQKNTAVDMSGRVFSVVNSLGDSSIPIAMLVFGFLLDYFPWHLLIAFYGIIIVLISIVLFRIYEIEQV